MTQLYFIFNQYFNNLLLEPKDYLTQKEADKGVQFAAKFYNFWCQYEREVFAKLNRYGLNLPSTWHVYFVYSKNRIFPMSSPIILPIKEDMQDIAATLIHELIHLMLLTDQMGNGKHFSKIWAYLQQEFKGESAQVIEHLIVNTIVQDILSDIFRAKEVAKIIDYEKTLLGEGIARAWSILQAQDAQVQAYKYPLASLQMLKYDPQQDYLPEEKMFR